uniref:Putative secreted protein n=1 Tax=Anopheles darlingi TaxID=43151 RepID=A0A2M4DMS2_ANODA
MYVVFVVACLWWMSVPFAGNGVDGRARALASFVRRSLAHWMTTCCAPAGDGGEGGSLYADTAGYGGHPVRARGLTKRNTVHDGTVSEAKQKTQNKTHSRN